MQESRIHSLLEYCKCIICKVRGHAFYECDIQKCRPSHDIHTVCVRCQKLFRVWAVYDGERAGYGFMEIVD